MTRTQNIAVIGGSGFIGSYIVRQLAKSGHAINVVSRHPNRAIQLKTAGSVGQITFTRGDISDEATMEHVVAHADTVINCTGILYETRKRRFSAIHAQYPERLAQAAQSSGVTHFIHLSALGVDEAPQSMYARSKINGESAVLSAFPNATILRPGLVFGKGQNFFTRFAHMRKQLPFLPLIGHGDTKFQPVYAGDVAKAVEVAITNASTQGHVYELGGTSIYSFRDLLVYICDALDSPARFVSIPLPVATVMAPLMELLPTPPFTRDQLVLLRTDNIVRKKERTLEALGIAPCRLEGVMTEILIRCFGSN